MTLAGSPTTYVPLSIHAPEETARLREQQARSAEQKVWWPSTHSVVATLPEITERSQPVYIPERLEPRLTRPASSGDLQEELSAAMSSQIVYVDLPAMPSVPMRTQLKTSHTHPLK